MNDNVKSKNLTIVIVILAIVYLISIVNSFYNNEYIKLITHYFLTGQIMLAITIPAFFIKYYLIDKINIELKENDKLWKKEIYGVINPFVNYLKNNLGFFIVLLVIAHILAFINIDYKLMKLIDIFGINLFIGTRIWILMGIIIIINFLLSLILIFRNKKKHKIIIPKRFVLIPLFLSVITLTYTINYCISTNIHQNVLAKLYTGVVNTETTIIPCVKQEILCDKMSIENLEKNKNSFIPNNDLFYPEIKDSANYIITRFISDIKNSKEKTLVYFYTLNKSFSYNDEWFAPVIVYNKENNFLIVDYKFSADIIKKEKENRYSLIGLSSLGWIFITIILEIFHTVFLQWRRVKITEKEEEIKNGE